MTSAPACARLSYLRTLPVGMLKIDGSFVRDVHEDPRAESMVQVIAQLARTMSLDTVAEYVETDEIRERIAEHGVDYGQGYAIGRAEPFEELLKRLPQLNAAGGHRGRTGELSAARGGRLARRRRVKRIGPTAFPARYLPAPGPAPGRCHRAVSRLDLRHRVRDHLRRDRPGGDPVPAG